MIWCGFFFSITKLLSQSPLLERIWIKLVEFSLFPPIFTKLCLFPSNRYKQQAIISVRYISGKNHSPAHKLWLCILPLLLVHPPWWKSSVKTAWNKEFRVEREQILPWNMFKISDRNLATRHQYIAQEHVERLVKFVLLFFNHDKLILLLAHCHLVPLLIATEIRFEQVMYTLHFVMLSFSTLFQRERCLKVLGTINPDLYFSLRLVRDPLANVIYYSRVQCVQAFWFSWFWLLDGPISCIWTSFLLTISLRVFVFFPKRPKSQ